MKREDELAVKVSVKDLAELMALALQIAAEVGKDPQYRALHHRVTEHQKAATNPRVSAFLGELLKSIRPPLPEDMIPVSRGQPTVPPAGYRKP